MNFEITCPNCKNIINEKSLTNNEQNLVKMNEFFNEKEKEYKLEFKEKLENKYRTELEQFKNIFILEKTNDLENKYLDNISQLKLENNNLKSQYEIQKKLITLELEQKYKQKENEALLKINDEKTELWEKINTLEQEKLQLKFIQNKIKGENFEYEIETELRKVFEPNDIITKFTLQDKKADFLQEIKKNNLVIGKITYEVKNAEWNNNWEKKLTNDMSKIDSKYGILVSTSFNKKYGNIPFKQSNYNDNIYLTNTESFIYVAKFIKKLIKIEDKFNNNDQAKDKYENYLEFKKWKDTIFPKLNLELNSNIEKITTLSNNIIKNCNDILIEKEKIYLSWNQTIKNSLDNFLN